jgi:dihydrodipicolinate synthase/N-acetylneuraminate lyase
VADQAQMRGVFTIPVTPFSADGALDEGSLRRCVEFCVEAGAHGIVAPVNASEAPFLSDDERKRVIEVSAETVARRRPVVAGVSGVTSRQAVELARHARAVGADAVIAMPPYVRKAGTGELSAYFRAIAQEGLPVFIQHFPPPIGTPMSAGFLAQLLREIDGVDYMKEESLPAGHMMSAVIDAAGPALKGVMGGMAGRFLLDEYRRGACGTMPACEVTDVDVAIWERLEAGDLSGARRVHNRLLPLLNLEWLYGVSVYKEILVRRGVIASAAMRDPGAYPLDGSDLAELDAILADVGELFTVAPLREPAGSRG